jgi:hypothetical protein
MTDSNAPSAPDQASQAPILSAEQQERLRRLFRLTYAQAEGRYLFDLMCRYRANPPHA